MQAGAILSESRLTPRLIDALYVEAMVLADEARSYFDSGRFHEEALDDDPALGVAFSCESLKTTSRLMHCIAWLLQRRPGRDPREDAPVPLATHISPPDREAVLRFPPEARTVTLASEDLYERIRRLEARMAAEEEAAAIPEPVVHDYLERLRAAF